MRKCQVFFYRKALLLFVGSDYNFWYLQMILLLVILRIMKTYSFSGNITKISVMMIDFSSIVLILLHSKANRGCFQTFAEQRNPFHAK